MNSRDNINSCRHMLLFTHAAKKHKLVFVQLSDHMKYLELAATWAENEWGYIRNKGVEFRKELFTSLAKNIYIGLFANNPVAMFALFDHSFHKRIRQSHRIPNTSNLMYAYVDKNYRDLGFGTQIIRKAKSVALSKGKDLILLDTLKPNLNRMYEKHGAKVICESQLYSHAVDVLRMRP